MSDTLTPEEVHLSRQAAVEAPDPPDTAAEAPAALSGPENSPGGTPTPVTRFAIVGYTPTAVEAIPLLDDPAWHVWGMNNLHAQPAFAGMAPKFDEWFDLHSAASIVKDPPHADWLARGADGVPVWTWEPSPGWPTTKRYPREEVIARFGRYFTNTVSWQVALALLRIMAHSPDGARAPEGSAIAIFGVDMATSSEYCQPASTRVLKSDLTWRPLGDIRVGDELVAFDEHPSPSGDRITGRRQYRKSKVLAVKELIQPCYRLEMADGTKLISSEGHRWLTNAENTNRWQTTERLHTPHHRVDRPSKIVKLMDVWDRAHQRDAGYLAAAFDGEGHLTQRGPATSMTLGFGQRDNAMLATVEAGLRRYGFDYALSDGDCRNLTIRGGRSEMIRFLGTIRPERLLEKFDPDRLGELHRKELVAVEHAEFLGDQPVIGITTETGTYISEGFASHNSAQRPSVEYFLGIAAGAGVEVVLPDRSDLLKCAQLYGESDGGFRAMLDERREILTKQLAENEHLMAQHQANVHAIRGALEQVNYISGVWSQPNIDRSAPQNQPSHDGSAPPS